MFKTLMEFVLYMSMKMGMSSTRDFIQPSFEVISGVISANTAVATLWPVKHEQKVMIAA